VWRALSPGSMCTGVERAGQDLSGFWTPTAGPPRRERRVDLRAQAVRQAGRTVSPAFGQAGAAVSSSGYAGDVAVRLAVAGEQQAVITAMVALLRSRSWHAALCQRRGGSGRLPRTGWDEDGWISAPVHQLSQVTPRKCPTLIRGGRVVSPSAAAMWSTGSGAVRSWRGCDGRAWPEVVAGTGRG